MKAKSFLPYITVLATLLLIAGGVYVWRRSLPQTENGEVFGISQEEIATDFPVDIPLFEPATVTSKNETKSGIQMTLKTGQPQREVKKFYEEQLAKEGWQKVEEENYKKGKRTLEVTFTEQEGEGTIIILSYEKTS